MRIGFDFDNTIVNYDSLFHKVAVEQGLVPAELSRSKLAVRDYLRRKGREEEWIVLQGYVYGARMSEAEAYPGALEFIKAAAKRGASLAIISHKTRHPFRGPRYDLHDAARGWADVALSETAGRIIEADDVYFELTKEDKVARIASCKCDYFIDDLPEIFGTPGFPEATRCILFDPERSHPEENGSARVTSWEEIQAYFEEEWKTRR